MMAGIVLAGGGSTRMGQDKSHLLLGGRSLLRRAIDALREVADPILVVGPLELPGDVSEVPLIPDETPGRGPLAGLVTGLHHVRSAHSVVVGCDLPFLNPNLLRSLTGAATGYEAVVPVVGDRTQALHAVYAASVVGPAESLLERPGPYSLRRLLELVSVRWITEAELAPLDPRLRSFFNINTPEDWETAQELLDR